MTASDMRAPDSIRVMLIAICLVEGRGTRRPGGGAERMIGCRSALACLLVQGHDDLGLLLEIGDARGRRWVGRQDFERPATVHGSHLLPERDGGPRIVSGARSQLHADGIGL